MVEKQEITAIHCLLIVIFALVSSLTTAVLILDLLLPDDVGFTAYELFSVTMRELFS